MAKEKVESTNLTEDELIDAPALNIGGSGAESDPLASLNKYRNPIMYGGIALLVVIAALVGYYSYYLPGQEEEAQTKAVQAFKDFTRDSLDKALKGAKPSMGLSEIADEYSGTKVGNLANYMAGVSYLSQNKIDEGVSRLNNFNKGDDMVSVAGYAALAYAAEEKKDFSGAADLYRKASETMPNKQTSPDFLFEAARCFELAQNKEQALAVYKELKRKYPTSQSGMKADKYIAKLSE